MFVKSIKWFLVFCFACLVSGYFFTGCASTSKSEKKDVGTQVKEKVADEVKDAVTSEVEDKLDEEKDEAIDKIKPW